MKHPSANQVYWLLVDLCEKAGFSMAIRDIDRFQAVVIHGPDVFTDAVLTPDVDKQMRRELNTFVAARFAQWEGESDAEPDRSTRTAAPRFELEGSVHRTLDSQPAPAPRGGR